MILVVAAVVIELIALCWWPTVFLIDGSDGSTRLGAMFLQRFLPLAPILGGLKSVVDWVVPGALWSWEALGSFLFSTTIVAFVAYAAAARALTNRAQPVRLRWIVGPLLLFQLTLIFVPASMTTDIYNYALYGEMPVLYAANPFVRTPAEFPESPLFYLIPLYWHDAPSVYGPLWVAMSAGVASLFRTGPLADELLFYRLIANVAHLVNTLLVWHLARRIRPEQAPSAALAYAWNPLLLLDFAFNGHNDVVMLTGLLGAFLLAGARRSTSSAVALGLSIATKYTSVLAAPLLLAWTARQRPDGVGRIRVLVGGSLLAALILAILYVPWVTGTDTFGPVLYWMSGPRLNNFWPEPLLITVTSWVAGLLGMAYDDVWHPLVAGFKLTAKLGLASYILFEAYRVRSLADALAGSARVFLVFLLLVNTWVMPWYYTWPLTIAAALGWHAATVRLCAGFTLTATLLMYQHQYSQTFVHAWGGLTLILPLVLLALPPVAHALRNRLGRSPAPIATAGPDGRFATPAPATSRPRS